MPEQNSAKQQHIKAERLLQIFDEITKTKRPSGNENEIRKYIVDFIKNLNNKNIEVVQYNENATEPKDRVIVVKKASNGGKSKIVLQAHMDMVCNPPDMTFPLKTNTEDEKQPDGSTIHWLKAVSANNSPSTLGADDGIGVASILALLENTSVPAGQLECLFTVQEETDMGGAKGFDKNLLEGRTYINLDSEEDSTIIYGSAGGLKSTLKFKPEYEAPGADTTFLSLTIDGLKSGHSGINISEGRGNAIQLMSRALFELCARTNSFKDFEVYNFNIASFTTNNKADNAIPKDASVIVSVSNQDKDGLITSFNNICGKLKEDYKVMEPNFKFSADVVGSNPPSKVMNSYWTDKLIKLLITIPHGVLCMEPSGNGLVKTSTNLAVIKEVNESITILCFHRSSSDSQLDWVRDIHRSIALEYGIEIENSDRYPVWEPNKDSRLLEIAKKVYQGYPKYETAVIHAGLECGWVVEKYKNDDKGSMDCISIGPTVKDPHTSDERLNVDSVQKFCDCLVNILTDLS
ncbi:MAG TPA: beta-Ala-His dipeptidase [Clostridia bacterium]